MAKLEMLKFEAAVLYKNSKKFVENLQQAGVVQLDKFDDKRLFDAGEGETAALYRKNLETIEATMHLLRDYGADYGGGMFSGRCEIERESFEEKSRDVLLTLDKANEALSLSRALAEKNSERIRCVTLRDSLTAWSTLDIPLSGVTTKNTVALVGSFPAEYTEETLHSLFAEKLCEIKEYAIKVYYSSQQITTAVVVCHKNVKNEISSFLRSLSFTCPADESKESVGERLKKLDGQILQAEEQAKKIVSTLREYAALTEPFMLAYDYFAVKCDEYEALDDAKFSGKTFYVRGYVPKNAKEKLCAVVKKSGGAVVLSEPSIEDDVPVSLSNGSFSEPCESIVEMYAIPGKSDIDPSAVMAFFYYLLFGMMLSDAGYGLVLGLGSALLLKFTSVEGSMRKMLRMFVYCGISTVFWGALFGSWFGDAIPVIRREFFGVENPGGVALWFDPISDPIKLLMFSFCIGICHLFIGVFSLGYMRWRDGDKIAAFCDTVPVFLTVLGAAPLAASVIVNVPGSVTAVAKYLAVAGVVLIVLTTSRSGNIFVRIGAGLYGLYNTASGYLSDILSYSRLLALGLATGSIGSVVNMLAVMIDGPVIKEIVFVVVFLLGHTLNMAINVLGAYVHTNRLQFVELFSKFYEGGGRAFKPLKYNTKYFRLKEEIKND